MTRREKVCVIEFVVMNPKRRVGFGFAFVPFTVSRRAASSQKCITKSAPPGTSGRAAHAASA